MRIGLVSHINPVEIKDYLYDNQIVPDTRISASSVHALITGFLKLGHQLVIFSPIDHQYIGLKPSTILWGENLKVIMTPILSKIDFALRDYYLPQSLARYIGKELGNLDVLHSQWTYENSVATLKYADKIPTFCSVRDWWPKIWEFNKSSSWMIRYFWKHPKKRMFEKTMRDNRIHFVANSEYTKQMILGTYPKHNVHIIPNPLKSEYIVRNRLFEYNHVFVSITPNLFDKRKNLEPLVRAFHEYRKKNKTAKLILIGKYHEDDIEYQKWLQNGWLEGVELCGFLSHEKVIEKLDEASVLIHPSLEDTDGNILLEGMSRRLLVIAGCQSGAVPSVLGDGKYGVLCDVTNFKAILNVLEGIITNHDCYARIVEAATSHLINDLTDEAVAQQHIELYKRSLTSV